MPKGKRKEPKSRDKDRRDKTPHRFKLGRGKAAGSLSAAITYIARKKYRK